MFSGMEVEFLALCEEQYRQTVVYPASARRALLRRELTRPAAVRRSAWWHVVGWHVGNALVRAGEHLRTTATARMAPHHR
jgi:hypothetical protein